MGRVARWLRTFLAYAMPAYLAVVATLALRGAFVPWPPATAALDGEPGRVAVMVGISTEARRTPARGLVTSKSHYYVLLPDVVRDPRLVRVTQIDGGPVTVDGSRAGFWGLLAALLACLAGTWWFWLRPRPQDGAPR